MQTRLQTELNRFTDFYRNFIESASFSRSGKLL